MNSITTLYAAITIASASASGLLAGALLTEAFVLVPYWRKMKPTQFLDLHHQMGPSLFRFFTPITIAGTLLPTIALTIAYLSGSSPIHWWVVSAACGLIMLGIYLGYFKHANDGFATRSTTEESLPDELSRWAFWHNLRTVIAVAGSIAALLAIS